MSLGKILGITAALLFLVIGILASIKDNTPIESAKLQVVEGKRSLAEEPIKPLPYSALKPIEISLDFDEAPPPPPKKKDSSLKPKIVAQEHRAELKPGVDPQENSKPAKKSLSELPDADRMSELFSIKDPKLSIVETVTYKSRVPWQKGRPAWLSDYASHFATSRHFIARSLNGKPDYLKQDIAEGDQFNVLKQDRDLSFQLVIDTSRCRMWFYAIDGVSKEKILLKTYPVSLGRVDKSRPSGLLTPFGKYSLGNRIAVYKPGVMGHHKGQKVEMIQVFGTRWIPFDKEISDATAPAKGFGIHGTPWVKKKDGSLEEDRSSLGKYESDGCVRMASSDVEELFAIIVTKPSFVELVGDYSESELAVK